MVASNYNHIWDCCCDHGLLGASLINKQRAPYIHLVDIVPELIHSLNEKLKQLIPAKSNCQWDTQCTDIRRLPLTQHSGKQLVIIAGIGGDLMAQLITDITLANPIIEIDFLLCPVHHLHTLRQQLIELNMRLTDEVLVKENQRIYEILLLSYRPLKLCKEENKVSPVGTAIWQARSNDQQQRLNELKIAEEYLTKTRDHYQRMQYGDHGPTIKAIFQAYQNITITKR
jgi:tRNA (adenine22-N1)-methyltransferase